MLRRLDCVLLPTKPAVLTELEKRTKEGVNPEPFLLQKAGQLFVNTSLLHMKRLMGTRTISGRTSALPRFGRHRVMQLGSGE